MYTCTQCNYSTTRKLNLQRHKLSKRHIAKSSSFENINHENKPFSMSDNKMMNMTLNKHTTIDNNKSESIKLFNINCEKESYGTIDIKLLLINDKKNIVKMENYILLFLCNIINQKKPYSIKISQINSVTTDMMSSDTSFIKNYSTKIYYDCHDNKDSLSAKIMYNYALENINDDTKIDIDYNIQYFGTRNIVID